MLLDNNLTNELSNLCYRDVDNDKEAVRDNKRSKCGAGKRERIIWKLKETNGKVLKMMQERRCNRQRQRKDIWAIDTARRQYIYTHYKLIKSLINKDNNIDCKIKGKRSGEDLDEAI